MSHAPPRYPARVVRRLAPPAPVRVGGRVVATESGSAMVQDVTGAVYVGCEGPPPLGGWVVAEGTWNGQLIEAGRFQVLNVPRVSFPRPDGDWAWLQNDGARRKRILEQRAAIVRALREFFDQRSFLEVDTPLMVPSPGLDVHLDAFGVEGSDAPRWLLTSPEYQMKRLLAGGLPRIYQVGKCFRRGEQGSLHEPEFTMLEWYRAFAGAEQVMRDTEELVAHLAGVVCHGSTVIPGRGSPVDVAPPWERLTVADAFQRYAGVNVETILPDEERFFRILIEQVEPQLGKLHPVFVTHWPASMASLARLDPHDPRVAERFEAYVGGAELCNGFAELIDPLEQRERLEADQRQRAALGKPVYPIDERFIGALEESIPPSGGNALGFDRLVMLLTGVDRVQEVLAVPAGRL